MLFITYNEALMWDRLERICVIAAGMLVVVFIEGLGSNPIWLFTSLAAIAAQILVVKCWSDMVVGSRPYENCWGFNAQKLGGGYV